MSAHFAKVDEGMAAMVASKRKSINISRNAERCSLRRRNLGEEMGEAAQQTAAEAAKKRKVEQTIARSVAPSASPWSGVASRAHSAGPPPKPMPGGSRGGVGAAARGQPRQAYSQTDLRRRVVVRRLPQVMRARLPHVMPELFSFVVPWLVRIQGPTSATACTIVLDIEALATAALERHREKRFKGIFAEGGAATPLVVQPDRERWLQNLLTMQWPVVQYLRTLPAIEDATCSKFRVGAKRYIKAHINEEGKDVLRFVGMGVYEEADEEGPKLNCWLSFAPQEDCEDVANDVRRVIGLAPEG